MCFYRYTDTMEYRDIILICIFAIIVFFIIYNNTQEQFVPVEALTEYKYCKQNIELFKKVVDFLERNNITYWAIGGTLLGAIRDKGMIPWDDDNDIVVPKDQIPLIESKLDELTKLGIGWCPIFFGHKFYDLNGTNNGYEYNYPFVDVFIVIKENEYYIYESVKARSIWPKEYFIEQEIFPLKKIKYEYYEISCMNDPIPFLDRSYDGWQIKGIKTYDHLLEKHVNKIEFPIEYDRYKKPYLFIYWDNVTGLTTPPLIELCYLTVVKNCSESFDIVKLNKDNILNFLPELSEYSKYIEKLQIAHKVDLYRIMLLYKYGGLYIDADTIILQDPIEIMSKLDRYDYVAFGCTGDKCKNGYGKPSNGILASRPNTYLFGKILMDILNKIKTVDVNDLSDKYKFNYFQLGKLIIWDAIKNTDEYEYYHYDNAFDGTRDKYGNWVTTQIIFSNTPIEYSNEDGMLFFTLYNSEIGADIKKLSKDELLSANWNVSKFLKHGLSL
jgi:phosphorylcholine metabolism protein LicD